MRYNKKTVKKRSKNSYQAKKRIAKINRRKK